MGRDSTDRIDGWKSIAAHLGRDRSTVIRWAKERALPVNALPGGKSRTVYAMRHELDTWMKGRGVDPEEAGSAGTGLAPRTGGVPLSDGTVSHDASADQPDFTPLFTPHGRTAPLPAVSPASLSPTPRALTLAASPSEPPGTSRRVLIAAAGAAAIGLVGLAAARGIDRTHDAPLDAAATAQLVQARDDLATRSEARLTAARITLTVLAARYPNQVSVLEALAEAWILAREYGSEPDALAFVRARAAADAAQRLDPRSAVADRVEGTASYWWDRDPARAGIAFRRAIEHAPHDALAQLWYANVLADNGEDDAARRRFTTARMLAPGAPWLLADYAWGLWSAGEERAAMEQLVALSAYSGLASVPDCLSVIALSHGDVAGYARYLHARAVIRQNAELTAYSAAVSRALLPGGEQGRRAAYAVMLSRAISLAENTQRPDHSWPAFIAHAEGDRAQLVALLREARRRGERWGAAGFTRRMRARWVGDATVLPALDALAQPLVEPAGTTA